MDIKWETAARRAALLTPAGPSGSSVELRGVVASLRTAAAAAPELVGEITGLAAEAETAARLPVHVIDRVRWSEANAELFAHFVSELPSEGPLRAQLAAEQTGLLLAALSTRVLGQFDPYLKQSLLLVAPNILAAERALNLEAADFRLWVALHEQTHALQFTAAPWLAEYLMDRIRQLSLELNELETEPDSWRNAVQTAGRILRGEHSVEALIAALLSEEGAARLDQVLAVMSLLEGHADVVMDAVGPKRIPSVRRIRAAFDARRASAGTIDLVLRRLTGLEGKLAQYREGAKFVRGVVQRVGHTGLNAVWAAPENLPLPAEISTPKLWLERVHG